MCEAGESFLAAQDFDILLVIETLSTAFAAPFHQFSAPLKSSTVALLVVIELRWYG
jgi:hypothetical protein